MSKTKSNIAEFLPANAKNETPRHISLPMESARKLDELCTEYHVRGRATLLQAMISASHRDLFGA